MRTALAVRTGVLAGWWEASVVEFNKTPALGIPADGWAPQWFMNQDRTVFSELIAFLPDRESRRWVRRYDGGSWYHMGFHGRVRAPRWPTPTTPATGASTPTSPKS